MRLVLIVLPLAILGGCQRSQAPPAPPTASAEAQPAAAAPVNPDPQVRLYVCDNGERVTAGYPDKDTAVVTYKGRPYPLKAATAASGVRYVGFGLQWWTKGLSEARLGTIKDSGDIASDPEVVCRVPGAGTVEPPPPGAPGGLPDDRTPVSEASFTPTSAQGAANVAQTYYALLGEKKFAEAWKLWGDGGKASGQTADQFARGFENYAQFNAQVGGPGPIEGAAGSLFVEVPVVIYGRLKDGEEVHESGKAVLRRVNDVPGSTAEQRAWRIARIELKP